MAILDGISKNIFTTLLLIRRLICDVLTWLPSSVQETMLLWLWRYTWQYSLLLNYYDKVNTLLSRLVTVISLFLAKCHLTLHIWKIALLYYIFWDLYVVCAFAVYKRHPWYDGEQDVHTVSSFVNYTFLSFSEMTQS